MMSDRSVKLTPNEESKNIRCVGVLPREREEKITLLTVSCHIAYNTRGKIELSIEQGRRGVAHSDVLN